MSRIIYKNIIISDGFSTNDLNDIGKDGWKLCSIVPSGYKEGDVIGTFCKEDIEDELNAKIRNKLGPIQTLVDLCKILKETGEVPRDILINAAEESEKSMEFLIHIGE